MHKYLPETLDPQAINDLLGFYGGKIPLCDAVDAAYHVGGYALGRFIPCEHPPVMGAAASLSEDEKVALLNGLKEHTEPNRVGAIAIPWLLVWSLVQQVVEQYLRSK